MSGLTYTIFPADLGWLGIVASAGGLCRLVLPQPSAGAVHRLLGDDADRAAWSPAAFTGLAERLKAYLGGQPVVFDDELDLSGASLFRRQVWRVTRLIPGGETRSYGWVAAQTGWPAAARAAGQALSRNPLPIIIPCHRVVARDGRPGGYSGGLEVKRRLLRLEARPATA